MTDHDQGRMLKNRLAGRDPLLVVNIDYTNASLVEFLGRCCADVIFIDCEQGDTDFESISSLVRAAHISNTPAIVRIFSPDAWVIERYLCRGIDGVVVPRLETAEQVRHVVDTVQYCIPDGPNDRSVVIQVETVGAARNIEEIMSVEGVDALFIGPVDLAKSMGYGSDYNRPEVAAEIDRLIDCVIGAGISVGMLATAQTIHRIASKGVNFLYVHTNDFLRAGSEELAKAKELAGGAIHAGQDRDR